MAMLSLLTLLLPVCRMMESKVAEAMSKKETLKARALSAETTKQLNDSIVSMVSGLVMDQHSLLCFAQDPNEQKKASAVQGCYANTSGCEGTVFTLQVSGLKSSTSGSLAAFERMEQKVVAMEAEADAVGQVGHTFQSVPSSYVLSVFTSYLMLPNAVSPC